MVAVGGVSVGTVLWHFDTVACRRQAPKGVLGVVVDRSRHRQDVALVRLCPPRAYEYICSGLLVHI